MQETNVTIPDFRPMIEHTLLKPEATEADILRVATEAIHHRFFGICIRAQWIPAVLPVVRPHGIHIVTVVGFPSGTEGTSQKVEETAMAVHAGADEVDMVLNRQHLKIHDYSFVHRDVAAVVKAAEGRSVKVILETGDLSTDEIIAGTVLSVAAGARFVKTSTGFGFGGATVEAVRLMRQLCPNEVQVKASGGIRSQEDALQMVNAGATRLGTSASIAIVTGGNGRGSY